MNEEKHSPTPWSFDGKDNIFDADGRHINYPDCYDANMRHIVEAVNERDRLHGLALAVKQMRAAQRAYFRTRDKGAIVVAINSEHDVDRWLEKILPENL